MFIWDFSAIFAVALILSLAIVLGVWMFYTFKGEQDRRTQDAGYFRQCRYCGHVYLDYLMRNPCLCPRCLSYHDP